MKAVTASGLYFTYPGAAHKTLKNLTFQIAAGSICCLLGVNGSGKTTLLSLLAGIFNPEKGEASVFGHSLPDRKGALKGKCALVPQDPDMYILGSLVEEDLLLALDPSDASLKEKALQLAESFGLSDMLQQPVHMLSYGQKRKLCLASALTASPGLLLLDEPFAGLDYPATISMRESLMRNKKNGITQIVTVHDLDVVADLADRFILLKYGELVSAGGPEIFGSLADAGVRPPCWWFTGGSSPLWQE